MLKAKYNSFFMLFAPATAIKVNKTKVEIQNNVSPVVRLQYCFERIKATTANKVCLFSVPQELTQLRGKASKNNFRILRFLDIYF